MHPRTLPDEALLTIHKCQSPVIDRTTTDFCQESAVTGMRVACLVTLKAATDVTGSLSDCFAFQTNINVVQLQQESIAIISQTIDLFRQRESRTQSDQTQRLQLTPYLLAMNTLGRMASFKVTRISQGMIDTSHLNVINCTL